MAQGTQSGSSELRTYNTIPQRRNLPNSDDVIVDLELARKLRANSRIRTMLSTGEKRRCPTVAVRSMRLTSNDKNCTDLCEKMSADFWESDTSESRVMLERVIFTHYANGDGRTMLLLTWPTESQSVEPSRNQILIEVSQFAEADLASHGSPVEQNGVSAREYEAARYLCCDQLHLDSSEFCCRCAGSRTWRITEPSSQMRP